MIVKAFKDKIILPTKVDVVKVHLYTKFVEKKLPINDNHLSILSELYVLGGYSDKPSQDRFFNACKSKKLVKSNQVIRNIITEYTNSNVLVKSRNLELYINEEFIPNLVFDKIILQNVVGNAD